jgi:hypothetical protein
MFAQLRLLGCLLPYTLMNFDVQTFVQSTNGKLLERLKEAAAK